MRLWCLALSGFLAYTLPTFAEVTNPHDYVARGGCRRLLVRRHGLL